MPSKIYKVGQEGIINAIIHVLDDELDRMIDILSDEKKGSVAWERLDAQINCLDKWRTSLKQTHYRLSCR